jgi:hypothetical protein
MTSESLNQTHYQWLVFKNHSLWSYLQDMNRVIEFNSHMLLYCLQLSACKDSMEHKSLFETSVGVGIPLAFPLVVRPLLPATNSSAVEM